ncbi:unnamed protein product, partial [Symbiodinium sp. KB8]
MGCDQDQQSTLIANGETSICRSYMESPFWGSEGECGVQGGFRVHCFYGLCCGRGFKACDSGQCCDYMNCGRSPHWPDFDQHCYNFDFTATNLNVEEISGEGFWLLNASGRLDGAFEANSTESVASWGGPVPPRNLVVLAGYSGVWTATDPSGYDYKMLSDGVYCTTPCTLNITVSSQQEPMVVSLYHNEEEDYCGSCVAVSVDPGQCKNALGLFQDHALGIGSSLFTTEDCPLQHCVVKS